MIHKNIEIQVNTEKKQGFKCRFQRDLENHNNIQRHKRMLVILKDILPSFSQAEKEKEKKVKTLKESIQ